MDIELYKKLRVSSRANLCLRLKMAGVQIKKWECIDETYKWYNANGIMIARYTEGEKYAIVFDSVWNRMFR